MSSSYRNSVQVKYLLLSLLFFLAVGVCDRPCAGNEECLEVDGKYQCTCKSGFARLGDVCLGMGKFNILNGCLVSNSTPPSTEYTYGIYVGNQVGRTSRP